MGARSRGEHFAWWCENRVEQSIDQFAGRPLRLEGWQREIFDEALAVDERDEPVWASVAIVLPRKNGKTTLLAAYALYRLIFDDGQPEILLSAASDRQAGRLFDAVCSFVRRSPDLAAQLTIRAYIGEIARKDGEGKILRMSSSPERLHGYNPSLVICDEVAQWRTPNLRRAWAALTTGGGARRQAQTFSISTAGEAQERHEGILGRMIDANEEAGVVQRRGALTVSRNAPGKTLVFNYSARTTDPKNLAAIEAANPASWITGEYLAKQAASPELSRADFLQLHGCVWSDSEDQWLTRESIMDALLVTEFADGDEIALGFDGSLFDDATALVGCRLEDRVVSPIHVWEKPEFSEGWEVPREEVDATLGDTMSRFRVARAYFDPPYWQSDIERWAREYGDEIVVAWYTAREQRMGPALERFRTDLMSGELRHDGDAKLVEHLVNARMTKTRTGYRIGKPRKNGREKIDCAVAGVLAYEACCDAVALGAGRKRSRSNFTFV